MEAELKFEREERNGVVAVGTYLFEAAGRMGIELEAECGRRGECDSCAVRIKTGDEFLSEVTVKEKEHLTSKRRKNGERLACQVKIEKAGEIVIMTAKKKEEEKPEAEAKAEEYRKEFEALPLEKKISSLLELEAIALGETFSFVINSPQHIVGKIMDVMAEFGLKLENDDKKAKRPREHETENGSDKAENAETVNESTDKNPKTKRQVKNEETDKNKH
jgi:ferredoxin